MKTLLYENKTNFIRYLIACFIPVISDLMRIGVIAMIFESVDRMTMEFFRFTVLAAILYLLVEAGLFILSRMMRIAYMRDTLFSLRLRAFAKIMRLDYQQYYQKSRDVYLSNLINDINTFEQSFFLSLINFVFRCGLYLVVITILFIMNWQIALIIVLSSILVIFISKLYEKKTIRLQEEVSKENENTTLNVSNTFSGLEILKLNNIEATFLKNSRQQIEKLEKKKYGFRFFSTLQLDTNGAIGYIIFMGLLVYLLSLTKTGMGYGELVLIVQLASMAVFPLVNMMPLVNVLKSSNAIYEKITKLDEEDHQNGRTESFEFQNQMKIEDLRFSYDDRQIFHDVDFVLEKGKKYLLKGASGSGKSTLIKLLSGIYDTYQGSITVDHTDLRAIQLKSFYDKVSYIYQEVFLFEASLKDNIALFKEVDEIRLKKAIVKSGLEEFVSSHHNDYDFEISENGKNLSGGERQRISIARALYKNAELLFIDEATSSLNEELARGIEETILSLDATVVAISHKYFDGLTSQYDYVLEIKDGFISQYSSDEYFSEAM